MSKVIRLNDLDLESVNECIEILNNNENLKKLGFKADISFVISSSLNLYASHVKKNFIKEDHK